MNTAPAALLFEHEDGRYAINPDTTGDPKWHRLGPVDVSALAPAAIGADALRKALQWTAAGLQAVARGSDRLRLGGEIRTVDEVLDAANAALEPPQLGERDELKRLADCCPELNLSNYGSDDVDELNAWAIEVSQCIDRALASAAQPPAGFVTVPVELTPAMVLAGADAIVARTRGKPARYAMGKAWAAMLEAASKAEPAQQPAPREPLTADDLREPKNGANWRVEWWNESARLMLPRNRRLDNFRSYKNGTMLFTLKREDIKPAQTIGEKP